MLRPFRYLEATTVVEASNELAGLGEQAKVYAGGAELLLLMREGIVRPGYLINVKTIAALGGVGWDGEALRIGATETHRRIEEHALVRERLPLLAEAARHIGNPRVRAQGTIGGNLCFADPHADPATALLVHETSVTVSGARGSRVLELAAFLRGTYEVDLAPDELLVEIRAKPLPASWRHAYKRFEQFYRPTVNAAVGALLAGGRIESVRLAVGCVGATALRLRELEAKLTGAGLADALRMIAESKPYLAEKLDPVDDLLGSAEFKVHLTAVLLGRALRRAAEPPGRPA